MKIRIANAKVTNVGKHLFQTELAAATTYNTKTVGRKRTNLDLTTGRQTLSNDLDLRGPVFRGIQGYFYLC